MAEEARLIHDAKRCYVYEYCSQAKYDGKITISKRILENTEIDFIDALECRDIEIVNSSDAKQILDLAGSKIDAVALSLITSAIDYYENNRTMPEIVKKGK